MRLVRRFCLAAAVLAAVACGPGVTAPDRRLVVLAVDGLDPEMTARLMRDGQLPNLSTLADVSGVTRVVPMPGAETFSTWAAIATGRSAGTHGIFDLVVPDGRGGHPSIGVLRTRPPAGWFGRWFTEGPAYQPATATPAFWSALSHAGMPSALLFVPGTFPPLPVENGRVIAGAPLPDWQGSPGAAYTWFATDIPASAASPTRYGGRLVPLAFPSNTVHTTLAGLRVPWNADIPLSITWNPEARTATLDLDGETVHLAEGQWSRWVEVRARLNLLVTVRGLVQLHLARAGTELRLYASPIQWHPDHPPSAISAPPSAARDLFGRIGAYRTSSWPDSAWALNDGYLTETAFLDAQDQTLSDREEAILNTLDATTAPLVFASIETLDTVSRMLWRTVDTGHPAYDASVAASAGGAIQARYRRLDAFVGTLRARIGERSDLIVFSPYGQYTARGNVDLNRWLSDEGLLAWTAEAPPVTLAALTEPAAAAAGVDWSRTSARAMGAGHIYLNVRGRDPKGRVEPGAGADALITSLQQKLERLTDPLSGRHVISRVRSGADVFKGPAAALAPDLVVSFAAGYHMAWDAALGGMGEVVVSPNRERWSADHTSVDERHVPGLWLSTLALSSDEISVLDIAPTVLAWFGQGPPAGAEGTSRLRDQPRESASSDSRR